MEILTVKIIENGWLVNGRYSVLSASEAAEKIEAWIAAGNTPEPQYTQAELDERAAEEAELVAVDTTRADTTLKNFISAGPSGIGSYIDANVTDMASAKTVLKILAKIVWVVARNQFK